tara:strand:- start:4380 stop:4823 length:444 start_codon:yes stop_codon:yes gene_type:complete
MKQIIENVLEDLAGSQINFESKSARETISSLLISALKSKGCYTEYDDSESKQRDISFQLYNEYSTDGLPSGGDIEAVLESRRLAEQIVNTHEGNWIYESPDGGETVFRRRGGEKYDADKKEEIDWKTKQPTGRVFSDYNSDTWKDER